MPIAPRFNVFPGEHMQAQRGEGFETRKRRLAKVKKGPGVFVYLGTAVRVDAHPTMLLTGKKEVLFREDGLPAVDASGRVQHRPAGKPMFDEDGKPVLGGKPRLVKTPITTFKLRGMEFPAGKEVVVDSPSTALKCRLIGFFEEREGALLKIETEQPEKPLAEMTKAELLEAAANEGVDLPAGANKADIADLIAAAREANGTDTDE